MEVDGRVGEKRGSIYIKKDINMGRLYNYYFGSPTGGRIYDRNLQRKSEETQSFKMTDTVWIPGL